MKKLTTILMIIFFFGFILTWQRFYTLQLTMLIDKQKNQYEREYNKYMKLHIKYVHLKSINRMEIYAADTLNMFYPNGDFYASGNND